MITDTVNPQICPYCKKDMKLIYKKWMEGDQTFIWTESNKDNKNADI